MDTMMIGALNLVLVLACLGNAAAQCEIFSDNQCDGDVIVTNPSFEKNRWFTPARGSDGWQASFQDFDRLVGSATVKYTSAERTSALVTVNALHRDGANLTYHSSVHARNSANVFSYGVETTGPVVITVSGSDGSTLELEPIDFVWNAPAVVPAAGDSPYKGGQKGAIIEFFGWPHADIAKECCRLCPYTPAPDKYPALILILPPSLSLPPSPPSPPSQPSSQTLGTWAPSFSRRRSRS